MRIWMPVRVVPAHGVGGGMEQWTWMAAHGLAGRGHDVTVATTAHPAGVTEERDGSVRVLYVPGTTWRRYERRWWDACHRRFLDGDYDVILSQSAGALGYLAATSQHAPAGVVLHGSVRGDLRTAWRGAGSLRGAYRLGRLGAVRAPRLLRLWRRAGPAVDHWIAVSPEVADDSRREIGMPADGLTVVPPAVDSERFRPDAAAGAEFRRRAGLPASAPVLTVLGRLEREKGVDVALAAAAQARRHRPDVRLVIAGHGHDDRRLRRLAASLGLADACTFLGLVPTQQVPSVLAATDVLLFPSRCAEGRPVSVVEAAATGVPVIASDSAGVRGVVADGETGLLVPRGDPAALAAAVGRLLDDPALAAAMGWRARQRAVSEWGVDALLDAVEDRLRQACAGCTHRR